MKLRKSEDKDYLLENSENERMSCNGLTKHLQRIFLTHFGKKISSSSLRHIFISNLSPQLTNKKLDQDCNKYATFTTTQQNRFIKKFKIDLTI